MPFDEMLLIAMVVFDIDLDPVLFQDLSHLLDAGWATRYGNGMADIWIGTVCFYHALAQEKSSIIASL